MIRASSPDAAAGNLVAVYDKEGQPFGAGLLDMEEFERIAIKAAHRQARKLQFFDRTGAGADHPVMSNCPESRYLKVLWARVV